MSKNPFHTFTQPSGKKVDVNLNFVVSYYPSGEGATLVFHDGDELTINESARTVRARTRKTWPADVIVDGDAE